MQLVTVPPLNVHDILHFNDSPLATAAIQKTATKKKFIGSLNSRVILGQRPLNAEFHANFTLQETLAHGGHIVIL